MSSPITNSLHEDVACPFCGLLCDDLAVRTEGHTVTPLRNACAKALAAYADASTRAAAFIDGNPATLDRAITAAVALLRRSRQPLIAGLGADVAGLRAAFALAEDCGAIVDHMHGGALRQNLRVLQSRGWQTTTLGELRNRADLVVLVGVNLNLNYQNLIPRFLSPAKSLQQERRRVRRLVYLGPAKAAPADHKGLPLDTIACNIDALPSTLRALEGVLGGAPAVGGLKLRTAITDLATKIRNAAYPVFVWAAGQLDPQHSDLTISAVCDLVAGLNRTQRAAGLNLGGDDGAQTALSAATWLTGFPLGLSFAGDKLDYAPERWSAEALLQQRTVDLCLWVSAFSPRLPPAAANEFPSIVLAPPGLAPTARNGIYIPVGTPGLDHAGQLIRTDAVVSLPLRQLRSTGLPSVATVLERIHQALLR